jgi:hypothetical protein
MSSNLHYEMARAREREIAARTIHAHHAHDLRVSTVQPSRTAKSRLGRTVAALGACLAATAGVAFSSAHASPRPAHASVRVSARQLAGEIRTLEAQGYIQWQCTPTGTLMRDSRGNLVNVEW